MESSGDTKTTEPPDTAQLDGTAQCGGLGLTPPTRNRDRAEAGSSAHPYPRRREAAAGQ